MKINPCVIFSFLIPSNIFYQGKLKSLNKQSSLWTLIAIKNKSIFNYKNTNTKNIKFKNKGNLISCINRNLFRG